MDTQFVWQEEYNIGVDHIDRQHQQLFKIINKLFTLRDEEKKTINGRARRESNSLKGTP